MSPTEDDGPAAPRVVDAVRRELADLLRSTSDPLARASLLSGLLAEIGDQVNEVTAERDRALLKLLAREDHPSHRALARELGMSRQRVDQLARRASRSRGRTT